MQKNNLINIREIFSERTGVQLNGKAIARPVARKWVAVTALVVLCLMLAAFTYPLFSPLDGDALSLRATYQGNGIVSVQVENRSCKHLKFQSQTKLIKWITGEEVTPLSENIIFHDLTVGPNSVEIITLDLSQAYDMTLLEQSKVTEWYYLVLTNADFLYGQEWKCSVYFGNKQLQELPTEEPLYALDPEILAQVEEELRFYFEDDYYGIFAANPLHYEYLQKVQELLLRSGKKIVSTVDPWLIIQPAANHIVFDETYPMERQYQLVGQHQTIRDAFGKLVGADVDQSVIKLSAMLPAYGGAQDQFWSLPIMYFAAYERTVVESGDGYAFLYGQIISFDALAQYLVYEDDEYCCYDVTHLFYTDLHSYVEAVVASDPEYYYFDDQCWERVENICRYYQENLRILPGNEWLESRPNVRIDGETGSKDLVEEGFAGTITSGCDMEKIVISITADSGETVYSGTFIPEDPRRYDLTAAVDAGEALAQLDANEYTVDVTVWMDSTYMSCQSVWSCMIFPGDPQ